MPGGVTLKSGAFWASHDHHDDDDDDDDDDVDDVDDNDDMLMKLGTS